MQHLLQSSAHPIFGTLITGVYELRDAFLKHIVWHITMLLALVFYLLLDYGESLQISAGGVGKCRRAGRTSCAHTNSLNCDLMRPFVRNSVIKLTPLILSGRPAMRLLENGISHQPTRFQIPLAIRRKSVIGSTRFTFSGQPAMCAP